MRSHAVLAAAIAAGLLRSSQAYELLWNVGGSAGLDLSPYPLIKENRLELFTTYFGRLPVIEPTGKWCNGGLPQLANVSAHAAKVRTDFLARQNSTYDGFVVVDYESWWASWNETGSAYHNASIQLAAQRHPSLPPAAVLRAAIQEYNDAAQAFLVATLRAVSAACPSCQAGMYSYPARYYWDGYCSPSGPRLRNITDSTRAVYEASGAIFPSVYQFYEGAKRARNKQYVDCNVQEAVRVSRWFSPAKPVYSYGWPRYHSEAGNLLDSSDTDLEFAEPGRIDGVSGAVIWGSEGGNATRLDAYAKWLAANKRVFISPPSGQSGDGSGALEPAGPGRRVPTRARPRRAPGPTEEQVRALVEQARSGGAAAFPPPFEWCSL